MLGTWPCTPIKTRPRQHGMKLASDAADPCQLLDDRRGGGGGDCFLCCSYTEVTEQHSDVTDVCCCSGRWRRKGSVSCFTVSIDCVSLHCVQAGGTDPDCLRSVFDYPMSISLSRYRGQNLISGFPDID